MSAMRGFTEEHGEAMRCQEKQKSDWPDGAGVPVLITEMDGSMLPVVEVAEPGGGSSTDGSEKDPAAAVLRTGPPPRPRGSGSCLLSLDLQPLEFLGLQRRPGRGIAHRFRRD